MKQPTIVITGANGLIGTKLVDHFVGIGWHVIGLVQKPLPKNSKNVQYVAYEMTDDLDPTLFKDADYLIHAAYIRYNPKNPDAFRQNIEAAKKIIAASNVLNLKKRLFISSMSSRKDALSQYGKQKYAIEQLFTSKKDTIVRPGLVIGKGGLIQQIVNIMQTLRVVPLVDGGRQIVQVISVNDLALAMEKTLLGNVAIITAAHPQKYLYRDFYKAIAKALRINVLFVPIPFWAMLALARLTQRLNIDVGVGEDNLLGLKKMTYVDTAKDLQKLGLAPNSLDKILADPTLITAGNKKTLLGDSRVRYLVSGCISFGVEFVSFLIILALSHHLLLANSLSFAIGVATGFTLHKFWSFAGGHTLKTPTQIGIYFVLAAINLGIANLLMFYLVDTFFVVSWFAKVLVIATIIVWNYLLYRWVIFKK